MGGGADAASMGGETGKGEEIMVPRTVLWVQDEAMKGEQPGRLLVALNEGHNSSRVDTGSHFTLHKLDLPTIVRRLTLPQRTSAIYLSYAITH